MVTASEVTVVGSGSGSGEGVGVGVGVEMGITIQSVCFLSPQVSLDSQKKKKKHTSRGTLDGDDLGGAATGGIGTLSGAMQGTTSMERVVTMTLHVRQVGQGSAGDGGRGGQENSTLHDDRKAEGGRLEVKQRMPAERVKRWSVRRIKE